jgi:hypothetical protein
MVDLGFPALTTEQTELLCQTAEAAAQKYIQTKVAAKNIDRLDISVEADGAKPVNVTVEINLQLTKAAASINVEALVKEAVEAAHGATENFLRNLK